MVITYTCIRKCYFLEAIRNPGDKLILDTDVGDGCIHLVPTPTDEQLEMQGCVRAKRDVITAEVSVPKAEADAVSKPKRKPKTTNGSKKA